MITMIHTFSGRRMQLEEHERVKKIILERCGWSQLVEIPAEPVVSLINDIPEEEEQPNDGYVEQSPQAAQKPAEATKPAPKHRRPKTSVNHA